jgi:bifunctional UDP-N-acetylglucosamine pyrophosphorylase/glucosamine-1-phosphate N-acetyltransferase
VELAIILAAGEGTRMKSAKSKVLHEIAGRSLLGHVLHACDELNAKRSIVVIGAHGDEVKAHLSNLSPQSGTVLQRERNGTGHAVRLALESEYARSITSGDVIVLAGDTPLLTGQTLARLQKHHRSNGASATVLTAQLFDPHGYGRIVRDAEGQLEAIVEESDCTPQEREIDEINSGVYIFKVDQLRRALATITTTNAQNEEYLTDAIKALRQSGEKVSAYTVDDESEILGINDRSQLALCSALMRDRINDALMREGVSIVDPATTWIDLTVEIAPDVTILPGTSLLGSTIIETGAEIGPRTTLIDSEVGQNARVIESFVRGSVIGYKAEVGPYTFLREGSELATGVRVGAYVEVKNSSIGEGSKVPHLSYVGDATIGRESNIGAATVFVNYDGVEKHRSEVGDHVRIGSDTMLVAPVTIGDGAYTAAGSVITEDVPAGAMGVARSQQRNVLGWVMRRRATTASAKAAKKAQSSNPPAKKSPAKKSPVKKSAVKKKVAKKKVAKQKSNKAKKSKRKG